ncbi:hypothetical protein M436DRAFT_65110 [Aureobasidium namibiae CBS 147.97]|uniref:Uncharacterized protein n=1 Tax=Aureobasidium namibiae CBS 147.97 TaxID=1043004 RepID=A0A074WJ59_9PEZI
MDHITDLRTDEVSTSKPWFQVMDPICLESVCKNDLEKWSIQKDKEEYLAIHQDGPFPLPDNQPLSSEQVRDSICLYKERMVKHHQHEQESLKTSSQKTKFRIRSFGNIAPSTKHLFQQLRAYRRKLTGKLGEQTCEKLANLKAELIATIDVVHQKLRQQNTTTSTKSPSSKSSLSSRASDLSQNAAKKVTESLRASMPCTTSEKKVTQRPDIISKTSWIPATTSKLAARVRTLVKRSPQATRKISIRSVDTRSSMDSVYAESSITGDHQNTQHSPITFGKISWRKSPTSSTASTNTLRSVPRSSTSSRRSTPPSPRSKSYIITNHAQQQPDHSFKRREWSLSGDWWPAITTGNTLDRQRIERGRMRSRSEDSGCGDRRLGPEVQRSWETSEEGYLEWKENTDSTADSGLVHSGRSSMAVSASVYSRSISGLKRD